MKLEIKYLKLFRCYKNAYIQVVPLLKVKRLPGENPDRIDSGGNSMKSMPPR